MRSWLISWPRLSHRLIGGDTAEISLVSQPCGDTARPSQFLPDSTTLEPWSLTFNLQNHQKSNFLYCQRHPICGSLLWRLSWKRQQSNHLQIIGPLLSFSFLYFIFFYLIAFASTPWKILNNNDGRITNILPLSIMFKA